MNLFHALDSRQPARISLTLRGIVQGVGFRPYIYNLAQRHQLSGYVLNTGAGVTIEVEGAAASLHSFIHTLPAQIPPLARIDDLQLAIIEVIGERNFVIRESDRSQSSFALVPSDICLCDACLADTRDSTNRRNWYPFTNCTNCGPRYSIVIDLPYDRPFTTMAEFSMCPDCRREYNDPTNRRFHAEPNACPVCGPKLSLSPATAEIPDGDSRAILTYIARQLISGRIIAWKGLGGYQLACDATREDAVSTLRRRKHRSEKPFAIMVAGITAAEQLCVVSPLERTALLSSQRPIVLLRRKTAANLAASVSPGNPTTGVMLPSTPMHDLLFLALRELAGASIPLVMTSGNLSEEPIAVDNDEAEAKLADVADLFVHHNRRIHTRVDDSVVRVIDDEVLPIRRARGFAPQPVWLGMGEVQVLACGAQQKNTLCLTKSGFAFPSQHMGDLENYETLEFFEQTRKRMCRLFHIEPEVIAHDLHPGYLSTQWALRQSGIRHIPVQHHHAHIAACMAEHQLRNPVIGVAWDGTGLGTDNTIWGGEFLIADLRSFQRAAHLRTVHLAGGDTAVREPWRVAYSYLLDTFIDQPPAPPSFAQLPQERTRVVDTMLRQHLHTVPTSSAGRLFDAVAALIGIHATVSYEGQAAVALEAIAADANLTEPEPYPFNLIDDASMQLDFRPMIAALIEEVLSNEPKQLMAARFHATLVCAIVRVCRKIRETTHINQVCLSGGCFQNQLLLRGSRNTLRASGFEVYFPRAVPANDGGISLGQAAIACETLRTQTISGA
ncbi:MULTISPECIES: carbamoyltransferase HypF [Acidobacterium]|uniref:Carbamoyltransferase n=1 Tax=Acidobacterium capsulatum (strain ATCC 51196 / DSM 11244 / BCRC 80197 / JCM 7670 / NBRC 15755 / NCIMB 13165 / 161) TaxID=240015 RepID=C1F4L8_ACIC5|nr:MULTISPECIES: carbamoyltransferase HypF [Acidobacterium]ACO33637.1 (NiFe) hydrogenase maturation protein HypF [Acidobacterium capsulatum ATCC 51196]HCT61834.1 carbamoyltransferase HypF [Acidobacterium sp.]